MKIKYKCEFCECDCRNKHELISHTRKCDKKPPKTSWCCKICEKCFSTKVGLMGHSRIHSQKEKKQKEIKLTPRKLRSMMVLRDCKFCGKEFGSRSIGAHTVMCKLNPKREETIRKTSKLRTGRELTECHKIKLSKAINEKITNGTWHMSFSKSRTHEYKGINFQGSWEVKYAMYLDKNGIEWRRPKETFPYSFEGKERKYTPDFFLIDSKEYIEIKGYKTPKDEAKWEQFPLDLKILRGQDLVMLGVLEEKEVNMSV